MVYTTIIYFKFCCANADHKNITKYVKIKKWRLLNKFRKNQYGVKKLLIIYKNKMGSLSNSLGKKECWGSLMRSFHSNYRVKYKYLW